MMDRKVIYYGCVLVSTLAFVVIAEPIFSGDNVCNKTITVRRDKTVEVPVKYELEYAGICHGFLPCQKTRVETRLDSRLQSSLEEMDVAVCCPGYAEAPNRECVPICLKPCNHGSCIAPGQCQCHPEPTETTPGFVGTSCNRFACLSSDRWGTNCERECNCPQNSYCSASTGKCICRTGWRGANCTEECNSTMNCDEVELPPIIDPESNIISSDLQKIEALAPRALLRDYDISEDSVTGGYKLSAWYVSTNLLLLTLVGLLLLAVWRVRGRLNMIKSEIYQYAPSSGSTPSGNSYYSSGTNAPSVLNRPRMPTPPETANLYGKNLNFDSATRYILLDGSVPSSGKLLNDIKVDSILEAHLIASQKSSKQNLYSDVELGFGNKSSNQTYGNVSNVDTSAEENSISHYQVPKSPTVRAQTPSTSSPSADDEQQTYGVYANDEQNIYEEITPRSP